jgi:hypothetical protein
MTAPADVLNQVVPPLVRLARRPGAWLLRVAALAVGVFVLLGLVHGAQGKDWVAWVPFVFALLLAVPVVTLAVRRHRLQVRTRDVELPQRTVSGSRTELVVRDGEPVAGLSPAASEAIAAAIAESRLRTARYLPRVEAAQRAAIAAAGGTVNAPYLKDDLRVTVLALLGTLVAIPVASFGAIVTALALLV